ncbi:hypothetical protein ABZ953_39420 [Streptomyces sp. NPDC046465]|uniref:hypothetical protein n=1 Tax=Streptomyces sp. NPDC046465 TaxID=3155810 RepID=UPI0033ED7DD0
MRNSFTLAKPQDLSTGFEDFFGTIGLTGGGLVTKGLVAVLAVIALKMLMSAANDPKTALRKGGMGVGVLFVALVLALYGNDLFSTVTNGKQG